MGTGKSHRHPFPDPMPPMIRSRRLPVICHELRAHVPFTALGSLSGALLLGLLVWTQAPESLSASLFWTLHPLHVVLSALVTTAMFRRHGGMGFWRTLSIGCFGSVGIATVSDCLLPYAGEWLLALPHRGLHLGFIEKWWLVNPLAVGGVIAGVVWPRTRFPHAGHVLLSTWASLFHMTMALGNGPGLAEGAVIALFLFLAVWLPCCTSDIVFPLVFAPRASVPDGGLRATERSRALPESPAPQVPVPRVAGVTARPENSTGSRSAPRDETPG